MLVKVCITVAVLVLVLGAGIVGVVVFRRTFAMVPGISTQCIDEYGHALTYEVGQRLPEAFAECARNHARLFLERDYPESKDLAKSFLTLLTALLVASLTFSEKIVDFGRASWPSKALMVVCWLSLLAAIVTCGVGLAFVAQAAGWAAYYPFVNYGVLENSAVRLFVIAGLSFGLGLATMLTAGIISLVGRERRPPGAGQSAQPATPIKADEDGALRESLSPAPHKTVT